MKARVFQRPQIASPCFHDLSREQDVTHALLALDPEGRCADGYVVKRKSDHPAAPPEPDLY